MTTYSFYLNKTEDKRFKLLAKKLGVTEYKLSRYTIEQLLADPFLLVEIQAKIKDDQIADKK